MPLKRRLIRKIQKTYAARTASPNGAVRWASGAPDTACEGKIPYPDLTAAGLALQRLRSQGRPGLMIYRCPFCHKFHVGHQKKQMMRVM